MFEVGKHDRNCGCTHLPKGKHFHYFPVCAAQEECSPNLTKELVRLVWEHINGVTLVTGL